MHHWRINYRKSYIPRLINPQPDRKDPRDHWTTDQQGTFTRLTKDIEDVESPLATNILDNINISKKKSFQSYFPGASEEVIDLLKGLLKFSPLERLTAEQAL
jgi:hypothetical protein